VPPTQGFAAPAGENTTIGVVVTDARLTKLECHLAAQSGHDGFARALDPAHTAGDGDALVVAATGAVDAPAGVVRALTAYAVEAAILDALDRA
jgi:L-aminopeptidase/D-esterase-like protein